jgi:hypothetical protein
LPRAIPPLLGDAAQLAQRLVGVADLVVGDGLPAAEQALLAEVGRMVEEDALGTAAVGLEQAVAAGSPRLLIVGFERARRVEVEDVAESAHVDAHPEGVGRHDEVEAVSAIAREAT